MYDFFPLQRKKSRKKKRKEEKNQNEEKENKVKKLSSLLSRPVTFHFICRVGHVATLGEISPYIEKDKQRTNKKLCTNIYIEGLII